jgi:hypothetical protein
MQRKKRKTNLAYSSRVKQELRGGGGGGGGGGAWHDYPIWAELHWKEREKTLANPLAAGRRKEAQWK